MKYDWLRDYEDSTLEPMELNPEERARILENALGKRTGTPKSAPKCASRKRKATRFLCLMAAVLVLVTLAIGAAAGYDAGSMLYLIFGPSAAPEAFDALGITAYPIGQSQTKGGYTVTLQGVFGDRHSFYLIFDVSAPAGATMNGSYGFQQTRVELNSYLSGNCGYYCTSLDDPDPNDSSVPFMVSYDAERVLPGKMCTLSLGALVSYVSDGSGDGEHDNEKILADETWEFEFKLDYADSSRKIPVQQRLSYNGSRARLRSVYVSPLSIHLEYRQSLTERLKQFHDRDDTSYSPTVILYFRDGSSFTAGMQADGTLAGSMSASTGSSGYNHVSITYNFDQPVNPEDLVSVEIDGITFPAG